MSEEKIFANGFIFKRNEKAPEFVVGRLSMKVDDAIAFMKEHQQNGWVNVQIKYARTGNPYVELDTYQVEQKTPASTPKPKLSNIEQQFKEAEIQDFVDQEEDELPF
jgi:uncharacterized protein YgiM (DUF1202 family)